MAQLPSMSGGLARALLDLARPILKWPPPAKKHVDAAEKRAAAQAAPGSKNKAAQPAPTLARHAVATAQIVRLESVPPLAWEKGAGFRCVAEDTIVTVRTSDGAESSHTYPADTLLSVVGGLMLLPDEAA